MTESHEFGRHLGLNIIEGQVVRLPPVNEETRRLKVPQVGWNRLDRIGPSWQGTWLDGLREGEWMYFVHSFYATSVDRALIVSVTQYGPLQFCSSIQRGQVFGCQFHPERSGPHGLRIYRNFAASLQHPLTEAHHHG
jgi:glutamine amidotransferase